MLKTTSVNQNLPKPTQNLVGLENKWGRFRHYFAAINFYSSLSLRRA